MGGCIGTELGKQICILRQFSNSTNESSGDARHYDATKKEAHTHTHTHFQVQGLEKGVSENEAPGPVGAYTTTHNDTITLMPNLIHRISFTELKFECRTRVAEGTSADRSTLRHNRTHAPTGPRRARTYMRIEGKTENGGKGCKRKAKIRKT